MNFKNKLGLGTVQFGLNYGINNSTGMVPYNDVVKIIECYNSEVGQPIYDTAAGYGVSQEVLGKAFCELKIESPAVVSKFSDNDINEFGLKLSLEKSRKELKLDSLYGFIAHSADTLINNEKLYAELQNLKSKGLIKKIGVSAYFPAQVNYFLENNIEIDLIQIPYNLFDQRFETVMGKCKTKGIEIHTRSAFLQGLIFKNISFFKDYFLPFKLGMKKLNIIVENTSEAVGSLALAFACLNPDIDKVIIGVDSKDNLIGNFGDINEKAIDFLLQAKEQLKQTNEDILLPFNWPKNE
jgi:aryl-alcohol dehydrogenase-like predicted oxidoreductase